MELARSDYDRETLDHFLEYEDIWSTIREQNHMFTEIIMVFIRNKFKETFTEFKCSDFIDNRRCLPKTKYTILRYSSLYSIEKVKETTTNETIVEYMDTKTKNITQKILQCISQIKDILNIEEIHYSVTGINSNEIINISMKVEIYYTWKQTLFSSTLKNVCLMTSSIRECRLLKQTLPPCLYNTVQQLSTFISPGLDTWKHI